MAPVKNINKITLGVGIFDALVGVWNFLVAGINFSSGHWIWATVEVIFGIILFALAYSLFKLSRY